MYLATVCSTTSWPNRASSDTIRGAPQRGFSRDMRRIRSRILGSRGGRPGLPVLDFHVQYSLNPFRCHLMTVSGWTMARAERQSGQRWESTTQKTRSRQRSFGRLTDCFKTATCCRRARFSKAAAVWPMRNALRKRKMDWMMPMVCRSRVCEMGHPTGMCEDEQTAGRVVLSRPPQNPQLRIFPGWKNPLS
jgi:hypothetical protein